MVIFFFFLFLFFLAGVCPLECLRVAILSNYLHLAANSIGNNERLFVVSTGMLRILIALSLATTIRDPKKQQVIPGNASNALCTLSGSGSGSESDSDSGSANAIDISVTVFLGRVKTSPEVVTPIN